MKTEQTQLVRIFNREVVRSNNQAPIKTSITLQPIASNLELKCDLFNIQNEYKGLSKKAVRKLYSLVVLRSNPDVTDFDPE